MVTKNQVIGAVSSVCQLPSFILTVIPTAAYDPGLAVCMAITVAMLPLVPFALRRVQDTGAKALLVALGAGLLLFNFTNALDALNGGHAAATNPARAKMITAKALDEKISELDVRKRQVEPHRIVSRESAQAAEKARDAECKIVGPKCRERENELKNTQRDRKLTDVAEQIEHDMDKAKADRAALGSVDTTADRTAAQLASFVGLFGASATDDVISTNRPVFRAFMVELLGGLGPIVLALVFGRVPVPEPSKAAVKQKRYRERRRNSIKKDGNADGNAVSNAKTAGFRPIEDKEGREVSDNVVVLPSKKSKRRKKE